MKIKDVIIKLSVEISRLLLGITFIFSGFVKADDPYGFAYKIVDYFTSFGLPSLSFLALPISISLCAAEFVMGACMLLGLYRKWNSRFVLLTMLFMTPLTLYLAIADPVKDCGCFGDAWIITNWETFFKNVVLLACAIFTVIHCERIKNVFTGKTYWLAFLYIVMFIIGFEVHNYVYDPLLDFRPYKIGANIPEQMNVEEGKGREEISHMIYAKDGKEERFTDQDAPWEDSTYHFVRVETELISEGEKSTIQDFSITKLNFNQSKSDVESTEDITQEVLADSNYTFLMISPSLTSMSDSYLSSFEDVHNYAVDHRYHFYCLTASGSEVISEWANKNTINFEFCTGDERTLKTIIRSNPGLLLLKNGVILNKWPDRTVPTEEVLIGTIEQLHLAQNADTGKDKRNIFYLSLLFILPLLALKVLDFLLYRKPEKSRKENRKNK